MRRKIYLLVFITTLLFNCSSDDDFVAACNEVTNVSSNSITSNSVTLTWDNISTAASYTIEYGISGFSLGNGTLISTTQSNLDLVNLNANTSYDVYIQTFCSVNNISMYTDVFSFTTNSPTVITEFRPTLSELNIFVGNLENLEPTPFAFEYDLNSTLFSDYSHKQRFIVLPAGEKMIYNGDGLPLFPNNTLIAKTFYYNNNETDLSQGKHIIETRVLIKIDGLWQTGDYKWNENQTEAVLNPNSSIVPVTWIDNNGETNSIDYVIPSDNQCFTCHRTNEQKRPIGPRLRTLNFNVDGVNQLQSLIDNQLLDGLSSPSNVTILPKWDDINYSLEDRARAYLDINCAHCHTEGGYCETQSILRLDYETTFIDSNILERKNSIIFRVSSSFQPGLTMPWIGTTVLHDEGVELILDYLDSLN
nr:fibronectin type III domain-containing protein [uncultured Psychroserpens sp.]